MSDLNETTVTQAVIDTFADAKDARTREVISALVHHLHDFVREVRLTEEEWVTAMDFLLAAGRISDDNRSEFILCSDTLGVSALVSILNNPPVDGATATSLLGPFFVEGAREVGADADLIGDNEGEAMVISGQVRSLAGDPIGGAVLDFWQNRDDGLYDVQVPDGEFNLRCRMHADDEGRFRLRTIRPRPYTVPYDGPVGRMLEALGRHAWRPAHVHVRIAQPGYRPLITAIYNPEDPYIHSDAVYGVRESLVLPWQRSESAEEAGELGVSAPFWTTRFDIALQPS